MSTQTLISIGSLATVARVSVSTIRRTAEQLGIVPAYKFDDVAYFDGDAAERIEERVRQRDKS